MDNIMKIDIENLPELMECHIHQLTEEELSALGFIVDLQISKYCRTDHNVQFKIQNNTVVAFIECHKNANISMGRSNKVKNGMSGLTSWGGVFSFADMMVVYRTFISRSYELTMRSPAKLEVYSLEEWGALWTYAVDAIFSKKGGKNNG